MKLNSNTVDGERPLTARSVVASTLLGVRPPALESSVLVRSGELFGIGEGTTRVALSRMVAAGELVASNGSYRLAGRLLERMSRQDESHRPSLRDWDGTWVTAIVTSGPRLPGDRAELRDAMRQLRLAELREGVWMRPDNLGGPDLPRARRVAQAQCTWLAAKAQGVRDRDLARTLWDLEEWCRHASDLRRRMELKAVALERGRRDALASAFVLAAAVLRHMQADPLLPCELHARGWPGHALRVDFDAFERVFGRRWRDWLAPALGGERAG